MLYHLASVLISQVGPVRLFMSYAVIIGLVLFTGFFATMLILPRCYKRLPHDRGREFTAHAKDAQGKPTGAGFVFISIFLFISIVFIPMNMLQILIVLLTWFCMLTGYLDDRSEKGWGEYRKALLDMVICLIAAVAICFLRNEPLTFWFPFVTTEVVVSPVIFIPLATIILWAMINTTNCSDGVDGLSATLVLWELITIGIILYAILGHSQISAYLLVPHISDGAGWATIAFALAGVLMAYLWHNAYPSEVLMGDAGSRALGFFTGVAILVTENPFLLLATSSIILLNGGMGLLKVFLLRFFKIRIFSNIRFPLHDHVRERYHWSANQVLIKFFILQILVTLALAGIFFKIR